MKANCPTCNQSYEFEAEQEGQKVECHCGKNFTLSTIKKIKTCPHCAETILIDAKKCRFCHESLLGASKSHVVYVFLWFLGGAIGLHNFYSGHRGAGAVKIVYLAIGVAIVMSGINSFEYDGDTSALVGMGLGVGALVINFSYGIYEICTVKMDSKGVPFR